MEILQGPNQKLVLVLTAAAVAPGTPAVSAPSIFGTVLISERGAAAGSDC